MDTEALFSSLAGPDGICAGGSVFSWSEALAAMANHPVPSTDGDEAQPLLCGARRLIEMTNEFLASPHVVALTDADDPLFTTIEMLDVQDRITARFTKGLHRGHTSSPTSRSTPRLAATHTPDRRTATAGHRVRQRATVPSCRSAAPERARPPRSPPAWTRGSPLDTESSVLP